MALAFANVVEEVRIEGPAPQGLSITVADVTLDTSYPTGGSAGVKAGLGVSTARSIVGFTVADNKGYLISYDKANDKLVVRQQPGTAAAGASPEVPNATNLSTTVVHCVAFIA